MFVSLTHRACHASKLPLLSCGYVNIQGSRGQAQGGVHGTTHTLHTTPATSPLIRQVNVTEVFLNSGSLLSHNALSKETAPSTENATERLKAIMSDEMAPVIYDIGAIVLQPLMKTLDRQQCASTNARASILTCAAQDVDRDTVNRHI